MKLLLIVPVCFAAVFAANNQNFNKEPEVIYTSDEALLFPDQSEVSFDGPEGHDSTEVGQITANRQVEVDGDENYPDDKEQITANRQVEVDGDENYPDEEEQITANRQVEVDGDENYPDEEEQITANRQVEVDGDENYLNEEEQITANRQIIIDGDENSPDEEEQISANRQIIIDEDENYPDKEEQISANKLETNEDQQIVDMSDLLGRARRCRKSLGGRCQNKKKSCKKGYQASPKGRPYCTSKHRICCYPAKKTTASPTTTTPAKTTTTAAPTTTSKAKGCPASCFYFAPSQQCFKMYNGTSTTWPAAVSTCRGAGLVLAKPKDPVSLMKYLYETYGTSGTVWLDGKTDGSQMIWQRDGQKISNSDSLWFPGMPGSRVAKNNCLVIYTFGYTRYPNQPYWPWSSCTSTGPKALCELLLK